MVGKIMLIRQTNVGDYVYQADDYVYQTEECSSTQLF